MDDPTLLSWIERGQNVAALLVAIGVAGEFALGFMAGPARRRVDAARDAEMIQLTAESANASERAANAEKQAGSFQLQIAQANKGAAEALERTAKAEESLENAKKSAAQANERAANAELELARIRTPRSLTHVSEVDAALGQFKGTEYVFVSVFQDDESMNLLKHIDNLLKQAGWKRGTSVGGFPGVNIYGKNDPNFSVPIGFNTGIRVSVESPQPLDDKRPITELPRYVQAAVLLNFDLKSCLSPQDERNTEKLVGVDTGTSETVRIAVGKKP